MKQTNEINHGINRKMERFLKVSWNGGGSRRGNFRQESQE